jgi:hypothetical protein
MRVHPTYVATPMPARRFVIHNVPDATVTGRAANTRAATAWCRRILEQDESSLLLLLLLSIATLWLYRVVSMEVGSQEKTKKPDS